MAAVGAAATSAGISRRSVDVLKGLPDPVETMSRCCGSPSETLSPPIRSPASLFLARLAVLASRTTRRVVPGGRPSWPAIGDRRQAAKRVTGGGASGREGKHRLAGEAGLGKTTLVAEASRAAFDNGACVLFGHCEEDLATPYQLFAEALGHYVTHAPEEQLRAYVVAHGSALARLVPAFLQPDPPDLPPSKATDADTERFLLFAAVVGLLAAWCPSQQPVVLVLDDLQWADKGSLQLLRHLAASEQVRCGCSSSGRIGTANCLSPPVARCRWPPCADRSRVSRIEIEARASTDTGVVALMEAAAGYHSLDDAGVGLAHAIYRETDGNPFFVSEVLRHLAETGAIFQDATGRGGWPTTPWTRSHAARQRSGGHRGQGRATGPRCRDGCCRWRR